MVGAKKCRRWAGITVAGDQRNDAVLYCLFDKVIDWVGYWLARDRRRAWTYLNEGKCPQCGYPLPQVTKKEGPQKKGRAVCPECGFNVWR